MRLNFYVEGYTEEAFVGEVLGPHFYAIGAHDVRPCLVWSAAERRRIAKGGGRNWRAAKKGLSDLMRDRSQDVRFTTMFDLYALFPEFPGTAEAHTKPSRRERVGVLEQSLAVEMADSRLIPYIQLHEFEALLFADCTVLGAYYELPDKGNEAKEIVQQAGGPEAINDRPQYAPSKRIASLFPGHRKRFDGPAIADRIGLTVIRHKCPHFDEWITRLENAVAGR